ncbi:type 4a pilus biogenesis protein PilO [Candidatus Uhrbacteria bacterium]|nr:type 4a pilus biogenesis protein PilO [Candidatus Uhrbacteria bacterium]
MEMAPQQSKTEEKPKVQTKILTQYYGATVLFLITLFLLVSFGFLRPIIDETKQTNAETKGILENIKNENTYLSSLDASIGAAQSIPSLVLKQVTEALPNEADTPSLLIQLDAAANRNAVKIQGVTFNEPKAVTNPTNKTAVTQVVPVDITLTLAARNYFDVKRFLTDLETSLRLMDVVGISTGGAVVDGQEFSFTVQVKTYTFNNSKTKGPKT